MIIDFWAYNFGSILNVDNQTNYLTITTAAN